MRAGMTDAREIIRTARAKVASNDVDFFGNRKTFDKAKCQRICGKLGMEPQAHVGASGGSVRNWYSRQSRFVIPRQ